MLRSQLVCLGLALVACESAAETLATVNGVPVDRELVQQELKAKSELARQPDADKAMLEKLIAGELLIQDAKANKLDQDDRVKQELAGLSRQVLANAAVNRYLEKHPVSDEEIKSRYEELAKANANEYHARHILVKTEKEAAEIRARIKGSDDFAEQATQHSLDAGNAKLGGDLGWFAPSQLVKPFSEAMTKLQKGEISRPVQTQFGWHVIELLDVRPNSKVPTLEETREYIAKTLASERVDQYIVELRAKAKITRP